MAFFWGGDSDNNSIFKLQKRAMQIISAVSECKHAVCDKCVPVITAWRIVRLQMEEQTPNGG